LVPSPVTATEHLLSSRPGPPWEDYWRPVTSKYLSSGDDLPSTLK
jgi:hypothetical protein